MRSACKIQDANHDKTSLPKLGSQERKSMIVEALRVHVLKFPDVLVNTKSSDIPSRGASDNLDKTIPSREDL